MSISFLIADDTLPDLHLQEIYDIIFCSHTYLGCFIYQATTCIMNYSPILQEIEVDHNLVSPILLF